MCLPPCRDLVASPASRPRDVRPIAQNYGLGEVVAVAKFIGVRAIRVGALPHVEVLASSFVIVVVPLRLVH